MVPRHQQSRDLSGAQGLRPEVESGKAGCCRGSGWEAGTGTKRGCTGCCFCCTPPQLNAGGGALLETGIEIVLAYTQFCDLARSSHFFFFF